MFSPDLICNPGTESTIRNQIFVCKRFAEEYQPCPNIPGFTITRQAVVLRIITIKEYGHLIHDNENELVKITTSEMRGDLSPIPYGQMVKVKLLEMCNDL